MGEFTQHNWRVRPRLFETRTPRFGTGKSRYSAFSVEDRRVCTRCGAVLVYHAARASWVYEDETLRVCKPKKKVTE